VPTPKTERTSHPNKRQSAVASQRSSGRSRQTRLTLSFPVAMAATVEPRVSVAHARNARRSLAGGPSAEDPRREDAPASRVLSTTAQELPDGRLEVGQPLAARPKKNAAVLYSTNP